jgi:hypothetical protein
MVFRHVLRDDVFRDLDVLTGSTGPRTQNSWATFIPAASTSVDSGCDLGECVAEVSEVGRCGRDFVVDEVCGSDDVRDGGVGICSL